MHFRLVLALIIVIRIKSQDLSLRQVQLVEFDRDEGEFLNKFKDYGILNSMQSIEINSELNKIAQQEAERLANIGRLELPRFNLAKSYYGFSFKRMGKIANIYVGYRMCHNNILGVLDLNVYKLNYDCSPSGIDFSLIEYVGTGRARDRLGNVFSTRMFFTAQTKNSSLDQDVSIRPRKMSLDEHDKDELAYIDSFNTSRIEQGAQPLRLNSKVTHTAQNEAKRLANLGFLDFPKHDLRKSYYGASFKLSGKIDDNYVGLKICHDSIVHGEDKTMHYMDENCSLSGINQTLSYDVGFGSALDFNGNIFKVRIFSLSNKDSGDKKKKRKTRNKKHKKLRVFAEFV